MSKPPQGMMDFTLVLHSRDIATVGLGDANDLVTCHSPTNEVPAHLLPATITLRIEIFSDQLPLAAHNLSFVANRHRIQDADDLAGAAAFAKESAKYNPSMSSQPNSTAFPAALKESAVLRVDKNECIEFGTSATDSVFGGTYLGEGMSVGSSSSANPFSATAALPSPADGAGFLVVSNYGGANSNASRYFITLRPMKEIVGNHTVIGRVRPPHPQYMGGIGNGFERLCALLKHPQFKINARTCIPVNKMAIADSMVVSVPLLPNNKPPAQHADPNGNLAEGSKRTRLAGKLRGRDDDDEASTLREEFEKGLTPATDNTNVNPFAASATPFDPSAFGAVDSRLRTTKKRRVETPLLSTAHLSLADQEKLAAGSLRTVAISTAQHFEGLHDRKANNDDDDEEGGGTSNSAGGAFSHYLAKKVFSANVSNEELQATFRPVGVNPKNMAPSNFNLFEANAMTFTSDLKEVLEQQLERQHNRERRMSRKQKAIEKQQQGKLGALGGGGAETAASAALKAALAATAASAAQLSTAGGSSSKANKAKSAIANVTDKLGRIRDKYTAMGAEHSAKAVLERIRAKANAAKVGKKRY